jgi:hypothetical protein
VVIKTNVGGSGAGIVRFDTRASWTRGTGAWISARTAAPLQEFVEAEGGAIVRVEVLDGRLRRADRAPGKRSELA